MDLNVNREQLEQSLRDYYMLLLDPSPKVDVDQVREEINRLENTLRAMNN